MGVCTEKDNLAVVMEYVEGRDLGTIVHDPAVPIPTKQRLHIAKQIAQGTEFSIIDLKKKKRTLSQLF